MADGKLKSARAIAIEVLNRCDPKKDYAGAMLERLLHETGQRQRATDLLFGTLRSRRAIDTVIAAFSGRPVERIQGRLLNIIRVGVYELLHCPSTETYAVVNEAVESAKTVAGKKQTGFVNAVLRQVIRHISNRQVPLLEANARRTLPQTPSTGCQFDTDFLPDGKASPVEYLSTVFSLPEWLVGDWLAEFGEDSTRQICFASNRRPSIYIRPNTLRTTTAALAEKLRQAGIELEICIDDSIIRIRSLRVGAGPRACLGQPHGVAPTPGFAEGELTVQDLTASHAVRMLNPQPDWTILDLCAAPGTKTTQLAEVTGDSATITATDIDSGRLEKVKENVTRLGIKSVDVVPYEELLSSQSGILYSKFDSVLLDVPCSNTGVLAKRVEARYRISPEAIGGLAGIQAELLRAAAKMVKPHGRICYSTCSIQRCENGELVRDFLKENPGFELESEDLTLPSAENFDHDGGYAAILVKIENDTPFRQ